MYDYEDMIADDMEEMTDETLEEMAAWYAAQDDREGAWGQEPDLDQGGWDW